MNVSPHVSNLFQIPTHLANNIEHILCFYYKSTSKFTRILTCTFLLFLLSFYNIHAQSCPLNLTITSQAEIDAFPITYAGCTRISGDLHVNTDNSDITNLVGLSQVTSIGGDLQIGGINANNTLTSLSGLDALTQVGGKLNITGLWSLTSLSGLGSLESVGEGLGLNSLRRITSLSGLDALTSMGTASGFTEAFSITYCTGLTTLQGIGLLTTIEGLYIQHCDILTNLSGLENVTALNALLITDNNRLVDFTGLENLTSISVSVRIERNSLLTSLAGLGGQTGETTLSNQLKIVDNASLSACAVASLCDRLGMLTGNEQIYNNANGCNSVAQIQLACGIPVSCPLNLTITSQAEIDAFPITYAGCTRISGDLHVNTDNSDITNLVGLSQVTSIGGDLQIGGINANNTLTSLSGLDALTQVGGKLNITGLWSLTSLSGLGSLESVGEGLGLNSLRRITSLSGLDALTSMGTASGFTEAFSITYCTGLTSLQGIGLLTTIEGLYIQHCDILTNLSGLENVTALNALLITDNNRLVDFTGLENLTSISVSVRIERNSLLTSLAGLGGQTGETTLSNQLKIVDNASLSACAVASLCDRLGMLTGNEQIYNNANGCNSVAQIQLACGIPVSCPLNLTITSQAEIDAFPITYAGCTRISGDLHVNTDNSDITNLVGLSQVTSIGGDLQIGGINANNTLTSLSGLDALTQVGGKLNITGLWSLTSLSGLGSLESVGEGLGLNSLRRITSLSGLDALTSMGTASGFTEAFSITYCTGLTSLQGIGLLTTIEGLYIQHCDILTNLSGLENVTALNALLITDNNRLVDFTGLENLTSISVSVRIERNSLLTSLAGLGGQTGETTLSNQLKIVDNASLSACAVASLCDRLGMLTGNEQIYNNANGCNSVAQIQLACDCGEEICQDLTVQLDVNGHASLVPADITNGLNNACNFSSFSLDNTDFTCSDLGSNNTTNISAFDVYGNVFNCSPVVTVEDNIAPIANQTTLVDVTTECSISSITPPTATDNCNSTVTATTDVILPITAQGTTTVTWTYTDENNNSSTQTQDVVISDVTGPDADVATLLNVTAECQVVSLTPPTATDNCGGTVTVSNNASLPIIVQGTTIVTWTYTDENGNSSTQPQIVVITDVTAPSADVATLLDITTECQVVNLTSPTATDNCGGAVTVTNDASLPITTQGTTTILWTYTDENNNSSTQTQDVVITDVTGPDADVATLLNVTAECQVVSLTPPTATDNCGGTVTVSNNASLPIIVQGTTIVTWTYTDENGNSSTQPQNVVINDITAPVAEKATLSDITAVCEVASLSKPTATDNCGGTVTVTNDASLPITTQGTTTITWTYTDENGNSSTQIQDVIIADVTPPIAKCRNVTLSLEADGTVSIMAEQLNDASTDNCGIASIELNVTDFSCTDVGSNALTLTITDINGNTSTCTPIVIINDVTPAEVITQDIAIDLDASGKASITTSDIDNGSNDACGIQSYSLNKKTFDCTNVGTNTVTLTVIDASNNVSSATAVVTVNDVTAAEVITQDIAIDLDASGKASITTSDIDNGSNDACGIQSYSLNKKTFDCTNVGTNTVTLTVIDASNNVSSATAVVTVNDVTAAEVITQDIAIDLDASGKASITTSDIDNGSNDACGIQSYSLNKKTFDCTNVGTNTVTLTVIDASNNVSSATGKVTVTDNEIPDLVVPSDIFVCENEIVIYTVPIGTDNCSSVTTQTMGLPFTNGSIFPVGVTTIEYTAVDPSGNSVSHSFDVRVRALPAVGIIQSELDQYCQGGAVVLSAVAPDAMTYNWSSGDETETTEVFASGTYMLTVANQYSCENTASIIVDYIAEDLLSSYTIIGTKEVHLHDDNTVLNGGVGVMDEGEKAKIHNNTNLTGGTTFVMAHEIDINGGSSVTKQIFGQPTVVLPTFLYGTAGKEDEKVDEGTTVTLLGTSYKKVDVEKNATVIFTQPDVSIKELHVGDNSTVKFSGCTYLRVEKKMHLHKNNSFNPDNYKVVVFIEDDKADIDEGTTFNGSIYTLDHEIKVKGKSNNPTYMNGLFISEKVKGEKNVTWNWNTNCGKDCPEIIPNKTVQPDVDAKNNSDEWKLNIITYPNPYLSEFSIELESDFNSNVTISIYNIIGKLVEMHPDLDPLSIPKMGKYLANGMYMVSVTQNGRTQVIKVNKIDR